MPHTTHTPVTPANALGALIARGRANLGEAKRSTATVVSIRTPLDVALAKVAVLEQRIDRASEELLRPRNVDTGRAINILLGHDDVPPARDCRA